MISRDIRIFYAAGFVRAAAVGLTGVIVAIALHDRGVPVATNGAIIGAGLIGAAAGTALVTVAADSYGRRRTLVVLAALTALGYLGLAAVSAPALLIPLAFVGMLNGMGRDRGAAATVEQASLPELVPPEARTWTFAWYNLVLDAGHTAGSAAAALPGLLVALWGLRRESAHAAVFAACGAAMLATAALYPAISARVEIPSPPRRRLWLDSPASRRILRRLTGLFALDSLGSGFLNSALLAFWFFERYHLTEAQVAALFVAARLLNAVSHVLAAWLARRIGLVNTMVFTHVPSSLFLIAVPFAPGVGGAVGLFLAREALVEMDVPARQSYIMAIVKPEERTVLSGVTNVTRLTGWAVGPAVAGLLMGRAASAAPLFIGASLKIAYDVLLYAAFSKVRAPEEQ